MANEVGMSINFMEYNDFRRSLNDLFRRGGRHQKAADQVHAVLGRVLGDSSRDPFEGLRFTKYGENRIRNCIKYDLNDYCRLITVRQKNLCVLCFVGDHKQSEKWLDNHRGFNPSVDAEGRLISSYRSENIVDKNVKITGSSQLARGIFYKKLNNSEFDDLVKDLPRSVVRDLEEFSDGHHESYLDGILNKLEDSEQKNTIYDVFTFLRKGDIEQARCRIQRYTGALQEIEQLSEEDIAKLADSQTLKSIPTDDPNYWKIFKHYAEIANYKDWMLFLHPDQEKVAYKSFSGPAKLIGISGSGKTCVVVKRAIYLAEKYPDEKILVLTLNKPLAALINDLVAACALNNTHNRIEVMPFFKLCQKLLQEFEPKNWKLYDEITWKSHEHIDAIWREYYRCELNNDDAAVMHPLHDSLISRNVDAEGYIREEFDWIRSAVGRNKRDRYYNLERTGRRFAFNRKQRELLLKGLKGWERKMLHIGVTDYLGIATALSRYVDHLKPWYRCILVDESQDFGTIELDIIRRLVRKADNDLFLAGDATQQVSYKHQRLKEAEIMIDNRSSELRKNYRNSRDVLKAAYAILIENLSEELIDNDEFKVLDPEYSNFDGFTPLLLRAENLAQEINCAIEHLRTELTEYTHRKGCLAICGFSLYELKKFGDRIGLPVLDGSTNIDDHNLYLSDLEQTKGFEFDYTCIANCNVDVIPNPTAPKEEAYHDLARLYVAMTRTKLQLILSYSGVLSPFIQSEEASAEFLDGDWLDYVKDTVSNDPCDIPHRLEQLRFDVNEARDPLNMTGSEFLYTEHAIGIDSLLIEKLRNLITGRSIRRSGKPVEWKTLKEASQDISQSGNTISRNQFGPKGLQQLKDLVSKF